MSELAAQSKWGWWEAIDPENEHCAVKHEP
jgi:hypothetical protein